MNHHRVYAEINLDNIVHNLGQIKAHVRPGCKVMGVIKADGYGHGAMAVANVLMEEGVDYLGVAMIHEAVALRKYKVHLPILVLGYTVEEHLPDLVKYDIIQTVFTYGMAEKISRTAVSMNKKAVIHLKVDSGMGRIGFLPDASSLEEIKRIAALPNLVIEGIFTHFAKADARDKSFTLRQKEVFENFLQALEEEGVRIPLRHASNSAGAMEVEEAHYELVRTGIALYGLYPSEEVDSGVLDLKPALSLVSSVIFVKEVEAGTPISYGGDFVTSRRTKVATIPVGYGDGYARSLSSKGRVLIRGAYAPILGRVCMDQFMVDVTEIPGVVERDEAVLIGSRGGNSITVEEVAAHMQTINYEVVCQIGKRVPRVFLRQGKPLFSIDYF
ncbi:alanine racemase [Anaerotalea alkaliphila]|uniref:Alanine racemase n=1 Tax=Anaerotalea alkaliphila TaxID=2662126 RepID=A0A7X5KP58_9FIRM|nr:alanine racemase [Anaerotalea alkaliphila]NDL67577.1 alanine racemase [Anaerotalea alkaliphila]